MGGIGQTTDYSLFVAGAIRESFALNAVVADTNVDIQIRPHYALPFVPPTDGITSEK